jgi:hypothetical protein
VRVSATEPAISVVPANEASWDDLQVSRPTLRRDVTRVNF